MSSTAPATTEAPSPPLRPRVAFRGRQATHDLEDRLRSDGADCPNLGIEAAKLDAEKQGPGDVIKDDEEESGVAVDDLRSRKLGDRQVVAALVEKKPPHLSNRVEHDKGVEEALEILCGRVSSPIVAMQTFPRTLRG